MIQSKPKSSSRIATGFFLTLVLVATVWLAVALIRNPESYFLMKLILTPLLLAIAIIVAIKSYSSAITMTFKDNKLTYQYLIGPAKTHKISEIVDWREDVVKQKSTEYRRITIQLPNNKKLHLSNQENSNYKSVINYLKKKV